MSARAVSLRRLHFLTRWSSVVFAASPASAALRLRCAPSVQTRNVPACVAFRRAAGNILEIDNLEEVWRKSPVLNEIRDLAVEVRNELDEHENGKYFTFCLGVAEIQTGNPKGMYPQAELNARAVRRHYELVQIKDPKANAKSA